MNNPYLTHFALGSPPFTKEVPDTDLWLPSSKQAVVDELVDATAAHESVALDGDPGLGKTCVLRAFRHRLGPTSAFRLSYCHNATLGRRDFYRQLGLALGISPPATAGGLFFGVSSRIEELGRDRIHPIFLLDEAHLLHQDTLDHLHILLNYEWDSRALLSLILVGLPELRDRLALRRNRSLLSRIHRRISLDPHTPEDTSEYVAMRLKAAGCDREIFTSDAIGMLHEAAAGSLREIDRVATAALRSAARRKKKLVERDAVARAIETGGFDARD